VLLANFTKGFTLTKIKADLYLQSLAVVLSLTASAKLASSFGSVGILKYPDPIFSIPFRNLLQITGIIELVVALICLYGKNTKVRSGLVAWLATNFLAYRFGLVLIGYHKPCPCLGNFTDVLHIPAQTADTAMKIILAYLLLGSYATLFWLWRKGKKEMPDLVSAQ
jgi:hypothetical protein